MPQAPSAFERSARADPKAAAGALQSALTRAMVPHDGGQAEVLADETRFQILTAGRRWGKTKLAARRIIRHALAEPDRLCWWVANFYNNTRRGYAEVVRQIPPELLAKPAPRPTSNTLRLEFKNGSVIEFYSGQSPDSLVGAGVDYMVIDEAALIAEHVWFQHLRPTLMDTGGGALIISTPRGRNWFWKLWKMGQSSRREYRSWKFTSYDNPYIPNEELDQSRESMPDLVFRQEVLAEFVDSAASIFDLNKAVITEHLVEPRGHVFLGVDLAKQRDFTVLLGDRDRDGMPCYYDRFNQIDWGTQKQRIKQAADGLVADGASGVTIVLDSTGLGDVVHDDLIDAGYDVIPINFSQGVGGRQKERMVRRLAADLEHQQAVLYEEVVDEFEVYEYEITDNGRWTFAAATGHDDKVSAKLLGHWGRVVEGVPQVEVAGLQDADGEDEEDFGDKYAVILEPDDPRAMIDRPEVWSSFGA